MKRLRDLDPTTPLQRKTRELLDAVEPLASSNARMQRVRRRLDEPSRGALGARRVPALVLAALVGLVGASAFAAVRLFVGSSEPEPAVQPAAPATKRPEAKTKPIAAPEVEPDPVPPEPAETAGTAAPRHAAKPARPRQSAHEQMAAHDSELVHRAVQALRRDGNPKLAARLLEQDRIQNPDGPLAEEALSLRIEAALELRDPQARSLARQYVTRYPHGRYLTTARKALGDSEP